MGCRRWLEGEGEGDVGHSGDRRQLEKREAREGRGGAARVGEARE